MIRRRALLALATVTALLAAVVQPLEGAASIRAPVVLKRVPHSLVGRVHGTRAYIALTIDGRHVRVYVCDGTAPRTATVSEWFEGDWDGRTPLALVHGGFEVHIDPVHADGRITGRLRAFSGPHRFSVGPVERPGGLYDATDPRSGLRVTWIVLADRSVRGAMVSPRPPKCRFVLVSGPNGTSQWVSVC